MYCIINVYHDTGGDDWLRVFACIYWDDGGSMKIIDRATCEWTCPNIRDAIVNTKGNGE